MNIAHLLSATRKVYALIPRPSSETRLWSIQLDGLSSNDIKTAARNLRESRKKSAIALKDIPELKVSELHRNLAMMLGASSFDHLRQIEPDLTRFLCENGMTHPTDLIRCNNHPFIRLRAQQVSERIFKSNLPLPKRLFTGVGSRFFMTNCVGTFDLLQVSKINCHCIDEAIDWANEAPNEIVLTAPHNLRMTLTRRDVLLHAYSFNGVIPGFNLIGDSLVDPMLRPIEHRLYNATDKDMELAERIFQLFRQEMESSDDGWLEVITYPELPNIAFLKGKNGAFDWVIKDQRNNQYSGNPYKHIFKNDELPSAMRSSEFDAYCYFNRDIWNEYIEHYAEKRHYIEGGTIANWPGYPQLMLKELVASQTYIIPPNQEPAITDDFITHKLSDDRYLMVSPLVTIGAFWDFYEESKMRIHRSELLGGNGQPLEMNLLSVNNPEENNALPASVTWYDAVAFCRYYELKTGLPVRLLTIEEWKQVSPEPKLSIEQLMESEMVDLEEHRCIVDQFNKLRCFSKMNSDNPVLRFGENLHWTYNSEKLPFLENSDFGEWLFDYFGGYAPAANALTGESLSWGAIERNLCLATSTMRYKGMKTGFRLCYLAKSDK